MIGRGLHLHFDCPSGVAGDMTLGALLDLGVDEEVIHQALGALEVEGLSVEVERVRRGSVAALLVRGPEEPDDVPSRRYREIRRLLEGAGLADGVKQRAQRIFARLARAEAAVHGVEPEEVHFHEVGGLDALADVVGAAAAIDHLAPAAITASPLPLGGGTVETRHGRLPVPAPATVELLRGIPVYGTAPERGELTTPTGAALLAELVDRFGPAPPLRLQGQGFGAGSRDVAGDPNVVRVLAGEPLPGERSLGSPAHLECSANLDDMNPELGPHVVQQLLESGAQDAWQEPVVMKKGRAGVKVCFLCLAEDVDRLAEVLLRESTTLGVRYAPVWRKELDRRSVPVETPYGEIRVKIAGPQDKPINVAPEFEDCRRAARASGVPLKVVYQAALVAVAQVRGLVVS